MGSAAVVMLLLRLVVVVVVVVVIPPHFPVHYPYRKSSGFDLPDRERKGLLREKEAAAKVLYYSLRSLADDLLPPFVARKSSDEALKCHIRENAFVTAQRDRSHCSSDPESAVVRTLRPLAWGWVKSRVFGDFHV